jgi:hypothetical protein
MAKIVRALVALALASGLVVAGNASPARADAASYYFQVDVVVRGTPPPGATIDVLFEDTINGLVTSTVELDDADAAVDIPDYDVGIGGRHLWVDPAEDAGAASISFACQMVGLFGPPNPQSSCAARTTGETPAPGPHAYAVFWGKENQRAAVTLTIAFGTCNGQPGTVFLGDGDTPTAGADVIIGTTGNDTVNGLGGNDIICGRGGVDTLRGGEGRDRLYGENGNDRLEGGAKGDWLYGGAGNETLLGQAGNDALDGGANRDTCNGGTERDTGVRCEVRNGIP